MDHIITAVLQVVRAIAGSIDFAAATDSDSDCQRTVDNDEKQ
jgi:hypothetical protein